MGLLFSQSPCLFCSTLGYFGFVAVHYRHSLFPICRIVSLNSHRQSLHAARTCFRAVFSLSLSLQGTESCMFAACLSLYSPQNAQQLDPLFLMQPASLLLQG